MENHINDIKDKFETHQFKKSGGTIRSIEKIRIMISQYKPLRGSSYFPLPDKVKNSKACRNIKMMIMHVLNIVSNAFFMILLIKKTQKGCLIIKR